VRLLLVEDDTMLGRAMRQGLADAGFAVDWVTDGRAAELALANGVYDLALLDLGVPGKDGMTLLTVQPEHKFMARGLVLILAVWMDVRLSR